MKKIFDVEIGIASAIGAIIGLMAAFALGAAWLWWVFMLAGALVAGLCYRPRAVLAEVLQVLSTLVKNKMFSKEERVLLVAVFFFLLDGYLIGCWFIAAFLTGLAAWMLLYVLAMQYFPLLVTEENLFFPSIIATYLVLGLGGEKLYRLWDPYSKDLPPPTNFVLHAIFSFRKRTMVCPRLPSYYEPHGWKRRTVFGKMLVCLWSTLLPFITLGTAFVVLADCALAVFIKCASSERLSAMLGAAMGFALGWAVSLNGFSPLLCLAVGGVMGFCSGPLIYKAGQLMEKALKESPAQAQVM